MFHKISSLPYSKVASLRSTLISCAPKNRNPSNSCTSRRDGPYLEPVISLNRASFARLKLRKTGVTVPTKSQLNFSKCAAHINSSLNDISLAHLLPRISIRRLLVPSIYTRPNVYAGRSEIIIRLPRGRQRYRKQMTRRTPTSIRPTESTLPHYSCVESLAV